MRRLLAILLSVLRLLLCLPALMLVTTASAQSTRKVLLLTGNQNPVPGPQAAAFLARTSGLTQTQKNAYTVLINGIVSDGDWVNLIGLYMYATNSRTNAVLNLVSTNYNCTEHGTVSFQQYSGYLGDASTFYLDTGINENSVGGVLTASSETLGVFVANTRTTGENWGDIGLQNVGGTLYHSIFAKYTDGSAYGQYTANATFATTNTLGMWVAARTSPTAMTLWHNGASVGTGTATGGLINQNIYVGALGQNNVGILWSGDLISSAFVGGGAVNVARVTARIQTFLTSSGVNVASAIPTTTPAFARAGGYKNVVFSEDFNSLADVDVNNTKTAGYKFYTGAFPYLGTALTPTPSGDYSASSSILTITDNPNPNLGGYEFATVAYLGASAPRTLGTTFSAGFYFEARMSFNPAQAKSTGWPAIWMQDLTGTLGLADNNPTEGADFGEVDMVEWLWNGSTNILNSNVNEWINNSIAHSNSNNQASETIYSVTADSAYHTYGLLWTPASTHSGTGTFTWYFDGVPLANRTLTYTSGGNFSVFDSDNFILWIDTGPSQTMNVDYVMVCQ